ncbi:MAG: PLD nuclease N-terminal domain-containing protein [Candidatus Methanoperedens sp.]|nr:PLD nuclease N-terminal domain-containing protein [Candidatus Methanoperedens sp.]HLB70759.1 PLD nuclease N-terminal domain-containing protein [Candidatus Methanoperedens sp.]
MFDLKPFFVFWLWMLIDCAKREIKNKTAWILILIFTSILGAILYYFMVRRKYKKGISLPATE